MARPATPKKGFWGGLERRIRVEWLIVTIFMMVFTGTLSYFGEATGLARLDHAFYDKTLAAAIRPISTGNIVIVAIDDNSIDELGYWPWRRALHAQLLARLPQARAVGLDLVLSDLNPAYPDDDKQLAEAIRRHGRVVLPLILEESGDGIIAPLPLLASAAKRLGYINIYPDGDGVIRSIVPWQFRDGQRVDHFATAMNAAADDAARPIAQQDKPRSLLLPYAGTPAHFTVYPYARVLAGQIPASAFQDKYVLIGSWGSGLGDAFPTPLSRHGASMAGVEILANALQSSLRDYWIASPGRGLTALLATLPVLLICILMRRLSPRYSFLLAMAVLFIEFAGNWLLMRYASVWVPLTASIIGVVLTYPVWSWRSQEAALQHIDRELRDMNRNRASSNDALPANDSAAHDGSLSARVGLLHTAIAQLRQAQTAREETLQFLSHDMRAPQNSILALTELQELPGCALPQTELLRQINNHAHKTLSLVENFVHLARAEAMTINRQPVDLVDLLEQACADFWTQARQRSIRVTFTDHPEAAWVAGDQGLLRRAWGNLLDNALKYSPDHSAIICRVVRDGAHWVASIRDQGRGVSAEQQEALFTRFTRVDEDIPLNPCGTGLGLAFVRVVVLKHGGAIGLESEPDAATGSGTEFKLRLPALADPDRHST